MAELSVFQGDITTLAVGAIVNAANETLLGGGGVDGAIHRAGGSTILEDCRAIVARQGGCPPGNAVVTRAGELPTGIVIHTVGPIWTGDQPDLDDQVLGSCYIESLKLAAKHNVRDIAFPNISTGAFGFPKIRAAQVAVNAVIDWLEMSQEHSIGQIIFVCFDDENVEIYKTLLG